MSNSDYRTVTNASVVLVTWVRIAKNMMLVIQAHVKIAASVLTFRRGMRGLRISASALTVSNFF